MNIVNNADCMEGMRSFPDKHFDLAVVDPPYGIGINVNMGRRKGQKKSNHHKFYGHDKETPDKNYFSQLFKVSKHQIIWGANYMIEYLYKSSCWLVYDKKFSDKISFAQIELAWTSFNSSSKIFSISPNIDYRIHPTQKPVKLYDWIFTHYAKPGMKILDTHVGSGSSRIAAHKHGLDFIGYELDPDYWAAQEKRFTDYKSQLTLWT